MFRQLNLEPSRALPSYGSSVSMLAFDDTGIGATFRVSDQIRCCQRGRQQLRFYNDVSLQPLTIMRASQSLFSSLIAISFASSGLPSNNFAHL